MAHPVEDKNPVNLNGNTPLHLAAERGHLKICQLLVRNGADKNVQNQFGRTPIQMTFNPNLIPLSKDFFRFCSIVLYLDLTFFKFISFLQIYLVIGMIGLGVLFSNFIFVAVVLLLTFLCNIFAISLLYDISYPRNSMLVFIFFVYVTIEITLTGFLLSQGRRILFVLVGHFLRVTKQ